GHGHRALDGPHPRPAGADEAGGGLPAGGGGPGGPHGPARPCGTAPPGGPAAVPGDLTPPAGRGRWAPPRGVTRGRRPGPGPGPDPVPVSALDPDPDPVPVPGPGVSPVPVPGPGDAPAGWARQGRPPGQPDVLPPSRSGPPPSRPGPPPSRPGPPPAGVPDPSSGPVPSAVSGSVPGGGGTVGRSFSQSRNSRPRASMPRPVQRLMLTPSALSMSSSVAVMPAIVTMIPYRTNRPPMMRRMSKRRAAVVDWASSSVISRCRSRSE